jgi:two-component sensor histidine kinase
MEIARVGNPTIEKVQNEGGARRMSDPGRVNILLVDDQPAKLMTYRAILEDLGENLLQALNAKEAFENLLKNDIALVLLDVCMPGLDGFELARMIRAHPRFQDTAIIFISAINISDMDNIRAYDLGAVDYVSVPVVPEILCAKVRVFVDLYRKTRALARLNQELEQRVADRTADLEKAFERQSLLIREVDHRAKNVFAIIQSIIHLTKNDSPQAFAAALLGRIAAMAHVHMQLSRTRWEGADLGQMLREELALCHAAEAVRFDGPRLQLEPSAAQSFAIMIHELITNATKYGALSTHKGHVAIEWLLSPAEVKFCWRESGGPPVSPPTREGFGLNVINSSIKNQLGGIVQFDWHRDGLHCEICLPAGQVRLLDRSGPNEVVPAPPSDGDSSSLAGRRILLVEDEPLIGLMMTTILTDLGVEVTGPIGSVADAFIAANNHFDAAVLDVNVGGQVIYPVADVLCEKGVHVVFVTGYENSGIEPRFKDTALLPKPIDPEALRIRLCEGLQP